MTPTDFIILMVSFGCIIVVWAWLYDGYKNEYKRVKKDIKKRKQEELTKSFNRNNDR